jgi:flagellar protein FlbT
MTGIDQLAAVFDDAESMEALDQAAAHALNKRFYPTLRALRTLIPREDVLMAAAEKASANQSMADVAPATP